jgi:glycosyltransferase involved in cell wall biosynthesis
VSDRLSVFIPAYNEEGNIEATVRELSLALAKRAVEYEIIIVNDGSSDRTAGIIEALAAGDSRIRALHNPRNLGLARTFLAGAKAARFEYVGWIPGDNGFPAASLEQWLAPLGNADLIQTYLSNAEVRYLSRRIISRAYTRTMNVLFGLNIKYYNGIQIYKRELIQSVPTHSEGFALLSEILVKLLARGCSYIEVGIKMQERVEGESKAVKLKNILDVIKTVAYLFFEIKIVHRKLYSARGERRPWPSCALAPEASLRAGAAGGGGGPLS